MNQTLNPLRLRHDINGNENHQPSLSCYCSPKVLVGKIYGLTGYEIFEEWTAVHT